MSVNRLLRSSRAALAAFLSAALMLLPAGEAFSQLKSVQPAQALSAALPILVAGADSAGLKSALLPMLSFPLSSPVLHPAGKAVLPYSVVNPESVRTSKAGVVKAFVQTHGAGAKKFALPADTRVPQVEKRNAAVVLEGLSQAQQELSSQPGNMDAALSKTFEAFAPREQEGTVAPAVVAPTDVELSVTPAEAGPQENVLLDSGLRRNGGVSSDLRRDDDEGVTPAEAGAQPNTLLDPGLRRNDGTAASSRAKSMVRALSLGLVLAGAQILLEYGIPLIAAWLGCPMSVARVRLPSAAPVMALPAGEYIRYFLKGTLLAPLIEEILHRACLQEFVLKRFKGWGLDKAAPWIAGAVSSVVFVLPHVVEGVVSPAWIALYLVGAALYAFAYHHEGFSASLSMHVLHNLFTQSQVLANGLYGPAAILLVQLALGILYALAALPALRALRKSWGPPVTDRTPSMPMPGLDPDSAQ
ncbi:MAG: lysostaphin resistance A-like protein [Elusimicrobiota bacterium]|jgi:membrane protease YdiL (CAAX protease family)